MEINDKMLRGYLTCALWSSTNEEGTPLDSLFSIEDLSEEVVEKAKKDCDLFREKAKDLIEKSDTDEDHIGHDFWLTRNRHGSGFWDGDYEKEIGEKLTNLSHKFGEIYFYTGDDGILYFDR